jgi:purine-nucleoside phosphorylase
VLRLARVPAADGRELRLALACGRPHRYEGWTDARLEAPVRALAAAGVTRLVLTNSCGALRPGAAVGRAVACAGVVDLQRSPEADTPERLPVCSEEDAVRVARALGSGAPEAAGTYVSVGGPQFETPAEVAWLGRYGDVVGMSAAPEVRAAPDCGVECCLLALVANVAAAVGSHRAVLAAGGGLARLLAAELAGVLVARWPDLPDARLERE